MLYFILADWGNLQEIVLLIDLMRFKANFIIILIEKRANNINLKKVRSSNLRKGLLLVLRKFLSFVRLEI